MLLQLGFVTQLGPLKDWGFEIEKGSLVVDPLMKTNLDRVWACGDITTFDGKLKLIATGFAEAAIAVSQAVHHIRPDMKIQPAYSTNTGVPGRGGGAALAMRPPRSPRRSPRWFSPPPAAAAATAAPTRRRRTRSRRSPAACRRRCARRRTRSASEFPKPAGKTLQALADEIGGGPQMGLAGSVYLAGQPNRVAFGVIDEQAGFVYGKTALYVARSPGSPAKGPYVAPADVLVTEAPYRSQQAATEADPFAAVYAAQVPFAKPGQYSVMAVTLVDGKPVAAPGQLKVITSARGQGPRGRRAGAEGADRHGRRPPAATSRRSTRAARRATCTRTSPTCSARSRSRCCSRRRSCASRASAARSSTSALQLRARYGDQVEFIHQEVYTDNDPNKGLRKPLQEFNLPTEPWLFVVGKDGKITARLEGSFGLDAFEQALKTAL